MSVEISDALARDLLWWLQNTSVPYVTVGERWRYQGGNRKEPAMEIARDSMVEELSGAMAHPDAMKDDFDATLDKQLSDMARACGQVYIKAKKSPPQCPENQGIESEKGKTSHHVVLTVEEAKEIYWLLEGHRKDYAKIDWENDREARLVLIKKQGALNEKWREALPKRIEQAESKDEGN